MERNLREQFLRANNQQQPIAVARRTAGWFLIYSDSQQQQQQFRGSRKLDFVEDGVESLARKQTINIQTDFGAHDRKVSTKSSRGSWAY